MCTVTWESCSTLQTNLIHRNRSRARQERAGRHEPQRQSQDVADASSERRQQDAKGTLGYEAAHGWESNIDNQLTGYGKACGAKQWKSEPDVDRVANGVPSRVDRLRALGNAVVPQQAYPIFEAIAAAEEDCCGRGR